MKKDLKNLNVEITYKDNDFAKERFIKFIVDYFLEENLQGRTGVNDS